MHSLDHAKARLDIHRRLERAEAEQPLLAAPDGMVSVPIAELRLFCNEQSRLQDLFALSRQQWRGRWHGSEPLRGSSILGKSGAMLAYLGDGEGMHDKAGEIILAHNALYDAFVAVVDALTEARSELYEAWHSHMSEAEFLSHPTIAAIDAAISKAEGHSHA